MNINLAHMNLINWLFTDPQTAGGINGPEKFHFLVQWIIFCSVGVLITFYYSVEGRKRFVRNKPLIKYMFDRYLGWLAIICIIGYPLIFARVFLDGYFFAWRVWRYLWLVAILVLVIHWIIYLVRTYPQERASYLSHLNRQQYIPKNSRRKAASSR